MDAYELQSEMTIVAEMTQKCVDDNAHRRQDQGEYNRRYSGLVDRFEKVKSRFTELTELIQERTVRRRSAEAFLAVTLKRKTPLTEFDEQFWYATAETATVFKDGRVVFKFNFLLKGFLKFCNIVAQKFNRNIPIFLLTDPSVFGSKGNAAGLFLWEFLPKQQAAEVIFKMVFFIFKGVEYFLVFFFVACVDI